jgi:hypothetical protein
MVARSAFIEDGHFLVRCLRYRFRTEKLEIKTKMRLQLGGATVLFSEQIREFIVSG